MFEGNGDLIYANRNARKAIQAEGAYTLPMATGSQTMKALAPLVKDERKSVPKDWMIRRLPPWRQLGLTRPVLVMGSTGPLPELRLTPREHEVLRAVVARKTKDAARDLHISVHTLRTQLKRIYRKLEVSGLNEALVKYEMSGGMQAVNR